MVEPHDNDAVTLHDRNIRTHSHSCDVGVDCAVSKAELQVCILLLSTQACTTEIVRLMHLKKHYKRLIFLQRFVYAIHYAQLVQDKIVKQQL